MISGISRLRVEHAYHKEAQDQPDPGARGSRSDGQAHARSMAYAGAGMGTGFLGWMGGCPDSDSLSDVGHATVAAHRPVSVLRGASVRGDEGNGSAPDVCGSLSVRLESLI